MESRRTLSRPLQDPLRSWHPERSKYGEPTLLNLGRKIFLSHSGKDKNFVRFLQRELSKRFHDTIAFFDEESLPKAVPVSMKNILKEARESKLGVLVLTEDFFMHTPNPMLELEAFVASKVRLLPLFFTISVDEFKEKSQRARWEKRWREWSIMDEGVMNVWRHALNFVTTFSGLEYCKIATNDPDYIDKIVNEVTGIMPPAISFSEKGVHGMDRMCKIVNDMYNKYASSFNCTEVASISTSNSYDIGRDRGDILDVVGIYGFGGLGKSTLCKCLCDFYFAEFNGKVCHIDLGSEPFEEASSQIHCSSAFRKRMKHVLFTLTSYEGVQDLEFSRVQNLLRERISRGTDPVFLAIDNVLQDLDSKNEADFYLSCGPFPRGSKIFITSRSRGILEALTTQCSRFSVVIEHIPVLEFEEARDIFVGGIPQLHDFGSPNLENEVKQCVNECVNMCNIWPKCYHPLMLKSLAASIRWDNRQNLDWKRRLAELRSEEITDKNDAWKMVFNMLDITYKVLSEEVKTMFLDLALFYSIRGDNYATYRWIQSVYSHFNNKKVNEILLHLQDLSFISMDTRFRIQVHDLIVDFSKHKVSQGIPHFLMLEDCAQSNYLLIRSTRSVTISRCRGFDHATLDLRDVGGVEVLQLVDNPGLQEVLLSPTTLAHLRSIIVRVPPGTPSRCTIVEDWPTSAAGRRTHGGPKWVQLEGNVNMTTRRERRSWLSSNVLSQSLLSLQKSLLHLEITAAPVFDLGSLGELRNLEFLAFEKLPFKSIDVKSCTKLKSLTLNDLPCLRLLRGLDKSTNLERLCIDDCNKLLALNMPADNYWLSSRIARCRSLERLTLSTSSPAASSEDCSTRSYGRFDVLDVSHSLKRIDGLSQYMGGYGIHGAAALNMEETFQHLLESAEVDSSICKATVRGLEHSGQPLGLAGVQVMELEDAQHIGLLISALFKAQPQYLRCLSIHCKEGGDCGCDKNVPLPPQEADQSNDLRNFSYRCSQVRDLSRLIVQWDLVTHLDLSGCVSVEVWPDFATLTSLQRLNISGTSLKEWPAGLLLLSSLQHLDVTRCAQLLAEELVKVITHKMRPRSSVCSKAALRALLFDLEEKRRDSCSIVDVLDLHVPELEAFCHDQLHAPAEDGSKNFRLFIELVYAVWFEAEASLEVAPYSREGTLILNKMRRLLSIEALSIHKLILRMENRRIWKMHFCLFLGTPDEGGVSMSIKERESYEALALTGIASIGWHNASVNDVKDRIINLVKSFVEAPNFSEEKYGLLWYSENKFYNLESECKLLCTYDWVYSHLERVEDRREFLKWEMLAVRVADAVCKMARAPSVAGELGAEFMHNVIQDLEARVEQDYALCKVYSIHAHGIRDAPERCAGRP